MEGEKSMNPNDRIRQQILNYFYDRNSQATSIKGKKGSCVRIRDVKKELKELHALKQQQVISNLTYLIDNGWVKTVDTEKTVNVKGETIPKVTITTCYEITAKGIDKVEGGSQFAPRERYAGINLTASGKNIITLGDGNIVNEQFADLRASLDELKDAVTSTPALGDIDKLNLAVDIECMKDQLAKTEPNKKIMGQLWSSLQIAAVAAGVAETYKKVASLVQDLLSP